MYSVSYVEQELVQNFYWPSPGKFSFVGKLPAIIRGVGVVDHRVSG